MPYASAAYIRFEILAADRRAADTFLAKVQAHSGKDLDASSKTPAHKGSPPKSEFARSCVLLLNAFPIEMSMGDY